MRRGTNNAIVFFVGVFSVQEKRRVAQWLSINIGYGVDAICIIHFCSQTLRAPFMQADATPTGHDSKADQ